MTKLKQTIKQLKFSHLMKTKYGISYNKLSMYQKLACIDYYENHTEQEFMELYSPTSSKIRWDDKNKEFTTKPLVSKKSARQFNKELDKLVKQEKAIREIKDIKKGK